MDLRLDELDGVIAQIEGLAEDTLEEIPASEIRGTDKALRLVDTILTLCQVASEKVQELEGIRPTRMEKLSPAAQ